MNQAAMRRVTLPTVPFIVAGCAGSAIAGAGWAIVGALLGGGAVDVLIGAAAAGVVGTAVLLSILVVAPWRPKPLQTWPIVWVAGSFVRLIASMGGVYLLYSATPLGGFQTLMAVGIVYATTVIGEAMVFARYLQSSRPS